MTEPVATASHDAPPGYTAVLRGMFEVAGFAVVAVVAHAWAAALPAVSAELGHGYRRAAARALAAAIGSGLQTAALPVGYAMALVFLAGSAGLPGARWRRAAAAVAAFAWLGEPLRAACAVWPLPSIVPTAMAAILAAAIVGAAAPFAAAMAVLGRLGRTGRTFGGGALVGWLVLLNVGRGGDDAQRPDVLLILIQQASVAHIAAPDAALAPHLAEFATHAVAFTQARTTSVVPSVSLRRALTGARPDMPPDPRRDETKPVLPLAAAMRGNGYHTALWAAADDDGLGRGYDHVFLQARAPADGSDQIRWTAQAAAAVQAWAARARGPWMATVIVPDLELPLRAGSNPNDNYVGPMDEPDSVDDWNAARAVLTERDRRWLFDLYNRAVYALDADLAPLLRSADRPRVVLIAGLNGFDVGAGDHPFGGATWLFESQLRIPLWVAGPGLVPRQEHAPVELSDLPATLADLLQLDLPQPFPGATFITARTASDPRAKIADLVRPGYPWLRSAAVPQWKLIRDMRSGAESFYDLVADPHETRPLHGVRDDVRQGLRRQLLAAHAGLPESMVWSWRDVQ